MRIGWVLLWIVVAVPAWRQESSTPQKISLSWKFAQDQKFELTWDARLKLDIAIAQQEPQKTDIRMVIAGTLAVKKVNADGTAECELTCNKFSNEGIARGQKLELLIERGEVKKAEGVPDGGKNAREAVSKPLKMTITARGEYTPENPGLLNSLFSGQGTIFGPMLPPSPVALNDTWEETLQTPQSKAKAGPSFKVTNTLASVEKIKEQTCARIVMDNDHEIEQDGMKVTFNVKSDSLFSIDRGMCLSSKASASANASGKSGNFQAAAEIDFEARPVAAVQK